MSKLDHLYNEENIFFVDKMHQKWGGIINILLNDI